MATKGSYLEDVELASAVMLSLGAAALHLGHYQLEQFLFEADRDGLGQGLVVSALMLLKAHGRDVEEMARVSLAHAVETLNRHVTPASGK